MRSLSQYAALSAALLSATASAGVVIVNHGEWTLYAGPYAAAFEANIANDFAGGSGGNFLIYSNNFGLNNSTLINAIRSAGHTVTVNTGVTFDLPTLSAYTGIFLGGYIGACDATVLTHCMNSGGHVYLAGGAAAISPKDTLWDSFLNCFGFGTSYNGISGNIAPSTSHPIFAGIASLYYDNGNTVILTGISRTPTGSQSAPPPALASSASAKSQAAPSPGPPRSRSMAWACSPALCSAAFNLPPEPRTLRPSIPKGARRHVQSRRTEV